MSAESGPHAWKRHPTASTVFPTARILFMCLMRTWLVGAGISTRGMQNLGLAYAMDPGLMAIYGGGERLRQARQRYAQHYNTHPFWTPLLVGVFLGMEKKISKGILTVDLYESVRGTTIYTLSAIGDSFFGGSVLVLWSLTTACLFLSGHGFAAIVLGVTCFAALVLFKCWTFWFGFREGLNILHRLGRWNLINWGQRFKLLNAGLLVAVWVLAWPGPIVWYEWIPAVILFGSAAALILSTGLSREILMAGALAVYLGLPWLKQLVWSLF
ncbi:PTS system mannose/fructose/sorbose family transporter subunit IID [Desulfovibrio ferrophilus]|uniref:PTS system mannose/fructose/sorbose family IID component n=1 Tax=Desulfovibrio ferrophilus TaxID=241368 RepID=A0A2Z6B080_9BACT|nr:PTS system mannose/fructose/sorbose family transporter subunit IID [Desulfovibrio ferrophilus]BBD08858.1 PTS system mannose/fructose/sorbose family IID component [Desulfovibrio ferrophilus]